MNASKFDLEVNHQVIDFPQYTPAQAYARLTSYEPLRPSFLLESLSVDGDSGRYSIVGYRVRGVEKMPPATPAIRELFAESSKDAPEQLAAAISRGMVGWLTASAAYVQHKLKVFPNEIQGAAFLRAAVVLLFDHHEKKAVVAGPVKGNSVKRCIWELANAPDIPEAVPIGSEHPDTVNAMVGVEKLQARGVRARSFLGDELQQLVLADTLSVRGPASHAAAVAVYRCWANAKPGKLGFLMNFGQPPTDTSQFIVFGFSNTPLHCANSGDAAGIDELYEQLPPEQMVGTPRLLAAKAGRRLEDSARHAWGGVVGYAAEGGAACIALMEKPVILDDGHYWLTSGAPMTEDGDAMKLPEVIRANLDEPLRAIASVIKATPEPTAQATPDEAQTAD